MRFLPITSLLLVLMVVFSACQSEQEKALAAYQQAKETFSSAPSAEHMTALLNSFDNYRINFPEQADIAQLTNEVAVALTSSKLPGQAIQRLQNAISEYPDAAYTPNNAEYLGQLYNDQLNQPEVALTTFQAIQRAYPDFDRLEEIAKRIPSDVASIETRLDTIRRRIYRNATTAISANVAERFVGSAESVALLLPKAETTPLLLAQAGEMARISGQPERAVALYKSLTERYSQHENAPQALFFQGFILENDLKKLDEARAAYEEFLRLYPEDDFADDTQFLLDNLGKDGVEIIQQFE